MKVLLAVTAIFVIAASVVFLGQSANEFKNRPTKLERSMQELDQSVERLKEANRRLYGD